VNSSPSRSSNRCRFHSPVTFRERTGRRCGKWLPDFSQHPGTFQGIPDASGKHSPLNRAWEGSRRIHAKGLAARLSPQARHKNARNHTARLSYHFGKINSVTIGQLVVHKARSNTRYRHNRKAEPNSSHASTQLAIFGSPALARHVQIRVAVFDGENLGMARENHRRRLWDSHRKIFGRGHSHLLEHTVNLMPQRTIVIDDRHQTGRQIGSRWSNWQKPMRPVKV